MATTENSFNGTGSQDSFSFTFPYLKDTDIKVSVGGVVKTVTTHYTLHTPTTIKFTSGNIPASGTNNVRIYRETADTALQATFYPGSAIRSGDLNDNFTQNLYVTQESNNDSTLALDNSRESDGDGTYTSAIDKASTAVTTANTASTNASSAVTTANAANDTAGTASTNATNAVNTANTPHENATTALNNSRESDGSGGYNSAISIANTAKTTANSATTTANTASTNASSAVTTANTASTNASNAVSTANAADTIADNAKLATDRLVATTSNGGMHIKVVFGIATLDAVRVGFVTTKIQGGATAIGDTNEGNAPTDIAAAIADNGDNFLRLEFDLDTAARAGATGGTELNFYYFGEANKVMYRGHLISEIDDPTLASHFSTATILAA